MALYSKSPETPKRSTPYAHSPDLTRPETSADLVSLFFNPVALTLWVLTIEKHVFLMVLGVETLLSKITVTE